MSQLSDDFPMMMEVEIDLRPESQMFGMPMANCPPVSVAFGLHAVEDGKASKAAGHSVYKDVEHVKIASPGDRNSLYFQPATDVYRKRFPRAYAAFKQRDQKPIDGMPIEQWAPVSRSLALTMKAAHIHTVEALAGVHDTHIDKLGFNAREFREKAKAWIATAKDGAATMAVAEEKAKLQNQLAAMQAQLAAFASRLSPQDRATFETEIGKATAPDKAKASDVEADVVAAARKPRKRASLEAAA